MDQTLNKVKDILSSKDKEKNVKRIKRESGLYERTECGKMLITEDNKLLLND